MLSVENIWRYARSVHNGHLEISEPVADMKTLKKESAEFEKMMLDRRKNQKTDRRGE